MRVFVAGGAGVIGRRLLPALIAAGHEAWATSRREAGGELIRRLGATPVRCDVWEPGELDRALRAAAPEVVVHQLTAIPSRIEPRRVARQLAATNRLRTEGTRLLLDAARDAGARRLVAQSIAFVHRPGGAAPKGEEEPLFLDAPPAFRALVEAVAELERLTTATPGIEGVALRYGFLYGPGTVYAPGGTFHRDVVRRRVPLVGRGAGVWSFVHVDDAVSATVAAVGGARPGIYQIVDDEPAPVAEWLPHYAAAAGARPPFRVPRWLGRLAAGPYGVYMMESQPAVSNAKARRELAWTPTLSTWREGFRELLARPEGS